MKSKIKIECAIITITIIYWANDLAGDTLGWFLWGGYCCFINIIYIFFDFIWWKICQYIADTYYKKYSKNIKYFPILVFSSIIFYIAIRIWIENDKGIYDYTFLSLFTVLIPKFIELIILTFKQKNKQ